MFITQLNQSFLNNDNTVLPTWYQDEKSWVIDFTDIPSAKNLQISCELFPNSNHIFDSLCIEGIAKEVMSTYTKIQHKFKERSRLICKQDLFYLRKLDENVDICVELVKEKLISPELFCQIFTVLKNCPIQLPYLFRWPQFGWIRNDVVTEKFHFTILNVSYANSLEVCYNNCDQSILIIISRINNDKLEIYKSILQEFNLTYQIDTTNTLIFDCKIENLNIFKIFMENKLLSELALNNILSSLSNYQNIPMQCIDPYRNELIFDITVRSKDVTDFKKDTKHIIKEVHSFLETELKKVDNNSRTLDIGWIAEIIKNSFDSYFIKGITEKEQFILKVVIKKSNDTILIKIKDNAMGFLNHNRGSYVHQITYQDKSSIRHCYGGCRIGLKSFALVLDNMNGFFRLKNRKEAGASIEITLKPQNK